MDDTDTLSSVGNPFEDFYSNEECIKYVKDAENACMYLKVENEFYVQYIAKMDPSSLPIVQHYLQNVFVKQSSEEQHSSRNSLVDKRVSSVIKTQKKVLGSFVKNEMLMMLMEESQSVFEKFRKETVQALEKFKARDEEAEITYGELKEAWDIFEYSVIQQGYDQLSQRIPAEKFIRFMDEIQRISAGIKQKLLLYTNSERVAHSKLQIVYAQKILLSENIHAVDFDKLSIENKNLSKRIDEMFKHTMELKKLNGWASVVITVYKNDLQIQGKDCVAIMDVITQIESRLKNLEEESNELLEEINKAKGDYDVFKKLKTDYAVPDTMEYVVIKAELYDAKKKLKIMERRNEILDITVSACLREMKHIRGVNYVNPEWFICKKKLERRSDLSVILSCVL
ncbi:uncharacterized protein LOC109595768 [Aethina tumida]|uniref:uncharacterized protein LOC109595768 n=1 Tax=Aethina tumida TaxID=116153 RepID=UPI0021478356|nr:uncharacterized protein LOC109595768 [Aethina tumida]